ncbi:polysaccharide deacetylase family protein [Thermobacillus sp. ZCTH02-B1]|uniref:polysaccharide deacetylase family protein n=1 Tax=Thermobacillus sp. ZCTH02-B1 TaxID=1858795 RepID=UPI0025DE3BFC|nr:polysaccharide deacetylase family protein [Thermobacillus sp. ZCTH02-B1]
MRKPALALAAAMLVLTSCGSGAAGGDGTGIREDGGTAVACAERGSSPSGAVDDAERGGGAPGDADASETPEETDAGRTAGGAESGSGADEANAGPGVSGGPDAGGQSEAADKAPPAPLYRMNGVYRFVPIDETAAPAKVVLLTFDDGPKDREVLERMLDALDGHDAKAVFFVNGYRAVKQPELLQLIRERGHMIGNHSWDHIDLKQLDDDAVRDQIGRVQELVGGTVGEEPKLFRPPYGSGGDRVRKIAEEFGLLYTTWSNGSLDWDANAKDKPDVVIRNVLDQLHPGANILMHELPWTADALDELLGKIEAEGYGFLDPALIEIPTADPDAGGANGA